MSNRFKVNVGYTRAGRERNLYFPSFEAATKAVNDYFKRTKIVLSIVRINQHRSQGG
jgi:hypothetical protein